MAESGNNEYFQTTENWERWDNQSKILKENFPELVSADLVFEKWLEITIENEGRHQTMTGGLYECLTR